MEKWLGADIPKLGLGMMRLPLTGEGTIDLEQVKRMVDLFLKAGFTYVDTAYGYHNEQSEGAVRQALVARYPRDAYLLATKLPLWHIKQKEDMQRLFDTQIERTGVSYFDFYMLHAYNASYRAKLDEVDAWGFMRGLKADGKARHIGLSFHDSADVLDEVLTAHPELEFVQLQINYADWDDPKVQSRLCYEVARKHGKSVVLMEPVKGGALAAMPEAARALFAAARPDASVASWAMRFGGSLDGLITVLSGMSSVQQMEDNIRTMQRFEPLTDADRGVIDQVRQVLAAMPTTPCTDCKYCTESGGCPQDIPIPGIIANDNRRRIYDTVDFGQYAMLTRGHGKASDCIQCGACEGRCPQHLPIIELMASCAGIFEK